MTDHDALLRAVVENPDDDAVRLVYADLIEEAGDHDRAAFIRTQIELRNGVADEGRCSELRSRERELLEQHAYAWAEPLAEYVSEWVYRRGFIEKVTAYLEKPAEFNREMLRLAPIRHIRDQQQFEDLTGVVELLPDLAGLTGLEFWWLYGFEDDLMRNVLTSQHLANLRTLILQHAADWRLVADDVMVEAVQSPHRANLRQLCVNTDGTSIGPSAAVVRAMAESKYLKRVRKLWLCNAELDMGLWAKLIRSMPRLERIDLYGCKFPPEVWQSLLERAERRQLKWLRMKDDDLPPGWDWRAFPTAGVLVSSDDVINPLEGDGWQGHSWERYRWDHLVAMGPFLKHGDLDGMESRYRADCVRSVGETVAEGIDRIPFLRYESEMELALGQFLERNFVRENAVIQLYAKSSGTSQFDSNDDHPGDNWVWLTGDVELKPRNFATGSAFEGFHEAHQRLNPTSGLDYGAAQHYLVARLLATLSRCVRKVNPRISFVAYLPAGTFRVA